MSQNAVDFSGDPSGAQLLDDLLTPLQQNLLSNNSGTSRPSYATAHTIWTNTTTTPWVVNYYDGADDIIMGYVNASTNTFVPVFPSAMVFKGVIDCSANPNYPAAVVGETYRVSVAGKIGGGSGINVEVGDILTCITNAASGNQATVGTSWSITQANIDGAVIGPAGSTSGNFPSFNGTNGKLLQDSGFNSSSFQVADSDLTAIAALAANGLIARTATGAMAVRTLIGGGGITVTNGDGVSGNPTLSVAQKKTLNIPAGAMIPSASGGCASLALIASGANQPDILSLNFDASTEEYAQFHVRLPKGWNAGTVSAIFEWSHPATTVNYGVVWGLQAVSIADNEAMAVAYGTGQTVVDTGGTTDRQYVSSETSAITIAGTPAAGEVQYFRVYRKAADGSDTMAVDARLHGIELFYTLTSMDDT